MTSFTIPTRGAYSLRETAEFGFGQRTETSFDGTLRLAFCLDGYHEQVGVAVRQAGDSVHADVVGHAPLDVVRSQTARMLSLDVDAAGYEAVGMRDPVVARLLAAAPGLRPPLFHSPYEAAAWCVLSLRWNQRQAAAVRERLSRAHGSVLDVAGRSMAAFPTPAQLLAVDGFPGLPALKLERLHGVARAALAGGLDAERLRTAEPAHAIDALREIPGIGPFSASLVLVRATGATDVLVDSEPRLAAIVGQLYDLGAPASAADLARIAEPWRPFRTWVAVLLRAAAGRLPALAVPA